MEAPQEAGSRDSLPLAPRSQDLFAFEWTDPEKGINGQLTWTRPPQGFRNSPTIFMRPYTKTWVSSVHLTLLQYVDDILWTAEDQATCLRGTRDLLQTIVALGYRTSAKKAQMCRAEVSYLGYKLKDGQRWLMDARKETVLRIPQPQTVRQVHGVRADLQDQPLPNADATWYMEGSSFVREGVRSAGAAATSETETVWAEPLAAERRLNGQNPHWPRR
ncbi:uncharacterized protein LOC144297841 isoform X2 [Canis aureus]